MFLAISLSTIQSCGTLFFWSYLSSSVAFVPRGQQQHGKVYEIPGFLGIKIKGFVVLRGWIKGFCPRIPGFLSKFVRDSHPVADPSFRTDTMAGDLCQI